MKTRIAAMKQVSILLSHVFNNYLKTCKLLEVPSPSHHRHLSVLYASMLYVILSRVACAKSLVLLFTIK